MKKTLSIILFLFLGIFLLIPAIFSLSLHHSDAHGGGENCITHCLFDAHISYKDVALSQSFSAEILLVKIIHSFFGEIYISALFFFCILIFIPPNIRRYIKNYNYSLLTGIIKLTT